MNQHRCIIISRQSKSTVANTSGNDILGTRLMKTNGRKLLKYFFQLLPIPIGNLELEKLKLGFYIKNLN